MGEKSLEFGGEYVKALKVSYGFIKTELRKQMNLRKLCPDLRNVSRAPCQLPLSWSTC